jgi:hypothetical protein
MLEKLKDLVSQLNLPESPRRVEFDWQRDRDRVKHHHHTHETNGSKHEDPVVKNGDVGVGDVGDLNMGAGRGGGGEREGRRRAWETERTMNVSGEEREMGIDRASARGRGLVREDRCVV